MENPHEQVQANILSRIIGNVKRLNESVAILNQELVTINNRNKNLEIMGAIVITITAVSSSTWRPPTTKSHLYSLVIPIRTYSYLLYCF